MVLTSGNRLVNIPCHPFMCGLPVLGHSITLPILPGTTLKGGIDAKSSKCRIPPRIERRSEIEEDTANHEIPSSPCIDLSL